MILPTKGITPDRSLLGIGCDLLDLISEPVGVSTLWVRYTKYRKRRCFDAPVTFDWFALALDLLFILGAVYIDDKGKLVKTHVA